MVESGAIHQDWLSKNAFGVMIKDLAISLRINLNQTLNER
jgi:hypothetical protein